jgi:spermidine/putrescine-binding protein
MKMTSRRSFLKKAGLLAGGVLISPFASGKLIFASDKAQLDVYSWYTKAIKEMLSIYKEETGTQVNFLGSYGGNPIWWTKMMAGEKWDFFLPSLAWVQRAARADMLEALDLDKIPNYKNLSEAGKKTTEKVLSYKGKIYSLPWTTVINPLVWNANHISPAPDSWSILWDEKYKGKISMKDEPRLAVMVAALYTGQDPNNIKDWDKIEKALLDQKKLVKKYWTTHDEQAEMLATEHVWLSQYNDGRVRRLQAKGVPVKYTVPKEGAPATIDCMAIPKNANNKDEAYKFMNFVLRPDIMALEIKMYGYITFDTPAYDLVSEETRESHKVPSDWYERLVWRDYVSPDIQKRMDSLWLKVKLQ